MHVKQKGIICCKLDHLRKETIPVDVCDASIDGRQKVN